MRHKRKKRKSLLIAAASLEPAGKSHLRLCHFCFFLNEASQEVQQCEKCHRYLTIDSIAAESLQEDLADDSNFEEDHEVVLGPDSEEVVSEQDFPLVTGLTVLW